MNTDEILEQIFDNGFAIKEVELGKKVKIQMKNLTAQDYIDMDPLLSTTKGTKLFVLQTYGLAKLSRAIVRYNGVTFKTTEDTYSFLKTLPAAIIDKLLKEHADFEKLLAEALNPQAVEEGFFDQTGSAEKLEQSQKDLTSDSQEG
jgi:hypothetical protein